MKRIFFSFIIQQLSYYLSLKVFIINVLARIGVIFRRKGVSIDKKKECSLLL